MQLASRNDKHVVKQMTGPKIVHVSPTYFSSESCLGGGERFAEELARAMSAKADVKLVSFGPGSRRERVGPAYERVILRSWTRDKMTPFSPGLFRELRGADVIHCHQYFVLPTFLAAWWGHRNGRRVFVSDLGGGGWTPAYHIDQSRWITAHLPISRYAARTLPGRNKRFEIIYGGVDLGRYPMRPIPDHDGSVVFLGRVLPHKGIHFLIEGLPPHIRLHVIGPPADAEYAARLARLAGGKRVSFHHGLEDCDIVAFLQRAMALVHPTPVDANGDARAHELFGLALVEAMACGCPVIASNAASLPEIVEDGVTGLLVPPNDPAAIRKALLSLEGGKERWRLMSAAARERVEKCFTWSRVAEQCARAYSDAGTSSCEGGAR